MIGWRKRASKENAYPLKEPPWPSLVSFWLPLTEDAGADLPGGPEAEPGDRRIPDG
jgi:hypothetical protein